MKSKNTQISFFLFSILLLPFFAMSQNLSVKRQIVDGALKCGYVDKTGKIVIALKFGQAENFIDDLAIVSENSSGKVIVEPIYTRNNGLTDSGIKLSRMFESKLVTDTFNSQGIKQ
jgi:hypothetical protein